jgi:hypothetical protein
MIMATDFAPGGATKIPCAKEAPDYRPARWSSKFKMIEPVNAVKIAGELCPPRQAQPT